MEDRPVDRERSVLIVDPSTETREVLRTALEWRGWRILEAGGARLGLELARQRDPDLIVLDLEVANAEPHQVCAPFAEQAEARQTPLVLLGSCRRNPDEVARGEFVPKPYHYAPLIRRIEELLDAAGPKAARSA